MHADLAHPKTGAFIDIRADVARSGTKPHSASEMDIEIQELCRVTVLANIGGFIDRLTTQLSQEICETPAFALFISTAVRAMEEAASEHLFHLYCVQMLTRCR